MSTTYVYFGEFRIRPHQIQKVEEVTDAEGTSAVLLRYGRDACILLYDEAADEARHWVRDQAIDLMYEPGGDSMPRPIQYHPKVGERTRPSTPSTPEERAMLQQQADRREEIRSSVLKNLGRPDDLAMVDVRELQDADHYRVNVYRTLRGVRKMTDSFYVYLVADGTISSPPMDRRYWDDILERRSWNQTGSGTEPRLA